MVSSKERKRQYTYFSASSGLAVARNRSQWLAVGSQLARSWLAVARSSSQWLAVARSGSQWVIARFSNAQLKMSIHPHTRGA